MMRRLAFSQMGFPRGGASRSLSKTSPVQKAPLEWALLSRQRTTIIALYCCGICQCRSLLIDNLTYDVDRDLVPIAATTAIVLTIAVSNGLAVDSIPDLIDVLRSNPGKYAWTSGPSLPRYVFASFLKRNGLLMNFVSYRDVSQPQADLGEGRIQVLVTSMTASSFSCTNRKSTISCSHQSNPRCRPA